MFYRGLVAIGVLVGLAVSSRAGYAQNRTPYTIGPADVLSIVFWRDKDLSADVTVRPDKLGHTVGSELIWRRVAEPRLRALLQIRDTLVKADTVWPTVWCGLRLAFGHACCTPEPMLPQTTHVGASTRAGVRSPARASDLRRLCWLPLRGWKCRSAQPRGRTSLPASNVCTRC
jgi:hypothetical protein